MALLVLSFRAEHLQTLKLCYRDLYELCKFVNYDNTCKIYTQTASER